MILHCSFQKIPHDSTVDQRIFKVDMQAIFNVNISKDPLKLQSTSSVDFSQVRSMDFADMIEVSNSSIQFHFQIFLVSIKPACR